MSGTILASTLQLQKLCERIVAAIDKFTEVQLLHVLRKHNKLKDSLANEDLELSEGRMLSFERHKTFECNVSGLLAYAYA